MGGSSIPDKDNKFVCSPKVQTASGAHPAIQCVTGFCLMSKTAGALSRKLTPSSAEVNNEWTVPLLHPHALQRE